MTDERNDTYRRDWKKLSSLHNDFEKFYRYVVYNAFDRMGYGNIDITDQDLWDLADDLLIDQLRIVSVSKFTIYENLLFNFFSEKLHQNRSENIKNVSFCDT